MKVPGISKFISSSKPISEEDLEKIKLLNTIALQGKVNGLISPIIDDFNPSFKEYFNVDTKIFDENELYKNIGDNFSWVYFYNLLNTAKNLMVGKYRWNNLPNGLLSEEIETLLFYQGTGIFFKIGEEVYFTSYSVIKYDYKGYPKVVRPIFKYGEGIVINDLKVNEECAILYNEYNSLVGFYGNVFKVWAHCVSMTNLFNEINNNEKLTRDKILVGDNIDEATAEALEQIIRSGRMVINADGSSVKAISSRMNGKQGGTEMFSFESRAKDMTETYGWHFNINKTFLGIKSNHQEEKKERTNTKEVSTGNEVVIILSNTFSEIRKNCLKNINTILNLNITLDIFENEAEEVEENDGEENDKNNKI